MPPNLYNLARFGSTFLLCSLLELLTLANEKIRRGQEIIKRYGILKH